MEITYNLNDEGKLYLKEIKSSAQRMVKLIKALLNFSRLSSHDIVFSKTDLSVILSECEVALNLLIKDSNATIVSKHLPTVAGSPELLSLLFQNLLSNSIKYRKRDQPLVIETTTEKFDDKKYKISIKDNGTGFDISEIDTILKPFGKTKPTTAPEGFGIGLPLCKKIIESHGGTLFIESKKGLGSTFSFTLNSAC